MGDILLRFVAVPRSLGWGLKSRLSAPNEGVRQTALSFGSRLTEGTAELGAPGSPSLAYFSWRSKRSKSPSRIATAKPVHPEGAGSVTPQAAKRRHAVGT